MPAIRCPGDRSAWNCAPSSVNAVGPRGCVALSPRTGRGGGEPARRRHAALACTDRRGARAPARRRRAQHDRLAASSAARSAPAATVGASPRALRHDAPRNAAQSARRSVSHGERAPPLPLQSQSRSSPVRRLRRSPASASSPDSPPRCLSRRWRGAAAESTPIASFSLAFRSRRSLPQSSRSRSCARSRTTMRARSWRGWPARMAGRGWHELAIAGPYAGAGALLALWAVAPLNALRIGELRARAVGVDVDRMRNG